MAEYIHLETKRYPLSEQDIRREMPNTSFPVPFPCPDGYAVVFPVPAPKHDPLIRFARLIVPQEIGGKWYQAWEVVPRFVEYTDEAGVTHSVEGQEAAAVAADAAAKKASLIASYEAELDRHLDSKARERRYNDRFTCALRAGFPGPYNAEGAAFAQWMDNCNAYAYQLMLDVEAGLRPAPTIDGFIAELPDLVWPE